MKDHKITIKLILSLVLLLSLMEFSACLGVIPKQFHGKWYVSGYMDKKKRYRWYKKYTITGNKYTMDGYPPIYETGTIDLLKEEKNRIFVRCNPKKSFIKDRKPYTLWLELLKNGKELKIYSETYQRIK